MSRPLLKLVMEGGDCHPIRELLVKTGINTPDKAGRVVDVPNPGETGGVDLLLKAISTEIKSAVSQGVAFVMDANTSLQRRWEQIRNRFSELGVDAPDTPPTEGFVGRSEKYQAAVGIWVMPDNQSPGAIEEFLTSMAAHQPDLVRYARDATVEARNHGAAYEAKDLSKARLRAYLAWQNPPGSSYGTAIRQGHLQVGIGDAVAFESWVRECLNRSREQQIDERQKDG